MGTWTIGQGPELSLRGPGLGLGGPRVGLGGPQGLVSAPPKHGLMGLQALPQGASEPGLRRPASMVSGDPPCWVSEGPRLSPGPETKPGGPKTKPGGP